VAEKQSSRVGENRARTGSADATSAFGVEQRGSGRLAVDFSAEYRTIESNTFSPATLKDLSAGGFRLATSEALQPGADLSVVFRSDASSLVAEARVLRCAEGAQRGYEVACVFR